MKVSRAFDNFLFSMAIIAVALLGLSWLFVCYDVVMRYFFNRPTVGGLEFVEYALIMIGFLSAAWVLKVEGHTTVDIVVRLFRPRVQVALNMSTSIIGAIVCLIITWWGAQTTWSHLQSSYFMGYTVHHTPFGFIEWVVPFGVFLLFIQFLRRAYAWRPGKERELLIEAKGVRLEA